MRHESVDLDLHLKIPADAKSGTQDLVVNAKSDSDNLQLPLEVTVGDVQFGFEITSSAGGMNFGARNFTVTAY